MYERKSPAEQEGINEALKEQDQVEWVRRMNNIRNRVEEIVREEILLKQHFSFLADFLQCYGKKKYKVV